MRCLLTDKQKAPIGILIVRVNQTIIDSSHFLATRGLYVVDGGLKDHFLGALEHGRSPLVGEKSVIWCVVYRHTDRQTYKKLQLIY